MKKMILAACLALSLGGCVATSGQVDIQTHAYKVVMPPATLLRCDLVVLPPNFKNNKEVANEIVKLWKRNQYCHNNMEGVKTFLNNAAKNIGNTVY
jgi:hypothetical protein